MYMIIDKKLTQTKLYEKNYYLGKINKNVNKNIIIGCCFSSLMLLSYVESIAVFLFGGLILRCSTESLFNQLFTFFIIFNSFSLGVYKIFQFILLCFLIIVSYIFDSMKTPAFEPFSPFSSSFSSKYSFSFPKHANNINCFIHSCECV